MPNYRRSRTSGGTFFFTVVTHDRLPIFKEVKNIQVLRKIILEVSVELPFVEVACVILHDHIHSIWQLPENDSNYSNRWGIIKTRFTKYLRSNGFKGQVWQKRFWEHTIKDTEDLNTHIDYIHFNPLKHGYVNSVKDWPYSSFHGFVDKDYYPIDWGGDIVIDDQVRYGE